MKVYLDEVIIINDVEVRHTQEGLVHLIAHYEHILQISTAKQLGEKERQHIKEWLLPNYNYHLQLYKTQNDGKQISNTVD